MKEKRISFGQGKGSLTHNNRTFIAKNVDESRIPDNVVFIAQPIAEAYEQLFGDSQERYNAQQKRNDRKIHGTYYESLFHQEPSNSVVTSADKRKSFYEDVVQIGKMEDSGIGTEDAQLVAECLKEYMNGFQARNPNFYIFNAILHMDEATPHLHIDYIPIAHHKRGMDTQNGIAKALEEMGFGTGKMAIARWRASEIEVLNKICREHGIEPLPPEKSRGTIECEEYREQRKEAAEQAEFNKRTREENKQLAVENVKLEKKNVSLSADNERLSYENKQLTNQNSELSTVNEQLSEDKKRLESEKEQLIEENTAVKSEKEQLSAELTEMKGYLEKAAKKKIKVIDVDSIETGKTVFGGKITVSADDYNALVDTAKKYYATEYQTKKLKSENSSMKQELESVKAELAQYRKSTMFSREKLKKEHQRISETENLRSQVRKYQGFIDACGLSEDFKKYTRNKSRSTEIE